VDRRQLASLTRDNCTRGAENAGEETWHAIAWATEKKCEKTSSTKQKKNMKLQNEPLMDNVKPEFELV